jgi:hypothetical protein
MIKNDQDKPIFSPQVCRIAACRGQMECQFRIVALAIGR